MEEKALLGIVLFPLLGAIFNGLLSRSIAKSWAADRKAVHMVACLSVACSFGLALYCFGKLFMLRGESEANAALQYTAYEWFSLTSGAQRIPVKITFLMDALSGVMTLIVTGIGLLIHIYSTGYMSEEKSYARFFAYLNLFMASMLILVLGSNLPLMFVGWEGVGLCSYLLIGFWWDNPAYAAAGRKAFVVNRIGDFGVLIGMFILVTATKTFEFAAINEQAAQLTQPLSLGGMVVGTSIATAATMFLFLGCTGKSAQIPLYVWLPDAMAGPTPVSALIHAATMVTSGIYLVCRLSPVFAVAPATMAVIAITGALTALIAATIGCVQNEIKKVLAYSTVSQLGFMFAGAGCAAFAAGIFHVYTHAFFKACLFLGAGSVMHAVGAHGDADIRRLGGLRKVMPKTHLTFLVSCIAIAGLPLFSGFYSKDEILVGALSAGHFFPEEFGNVGYAVFAMLLLAATMTAFYMFRLYFMVFSGEYRGGPEHHEEPAAAHAAPAHTDDHGHGHGHGGPHESPPSMTIPLLVLGFGAVFAGYVWVGAGHLVGAHLDFWLEWLRPAVFVAEGEHENSVLLTALLAGTTVAVVGSLLAWTWYGKAVPSPAPAGLAQRFPGVHAFLMDKWRVDELYDATILRASRALGLTAAGIDKTFIDGMLTGATAAGVRAVGFGFSRMQNGLVQAYAFAMVIGVIVAAFWFTVPHAKIEVPDAPKGDEVQFRASAGLGYAYRWDFDGNGEPDTDWSADPAASHTFSDEEFQPGVVVAFEPGTYGAGIQRKHLAPGATWVLEAGRLGGFWQSEPDTTTPPSLTVTEQGLVVRANGARLRRDGQTVTEPEVLLKRGEHIDIGQARVTAAGQVRVAVRVRNAFGAERDRHLSLVLPEVRKRVSLEVGGVAEANP